MDVARSDSMRSRVAMLWREINWSVRSTGKGGLRGTECTTGHIQSTASILDNART